MRRPRLSSRQPIEAAATPFPREETTPPVTKMYFVPMGKALESLQWGRRTTDYAGKAHVCQIRISKRRNYFSGMPRRICLARGGSAVVHMATPPFAFRRPKEFELDMRDPAPPGADSDTARPRGVGMAPIDAALAPKIPPATQPIEYYKRHSLAAQNWGALTPSGAPLRQLSAEEAQATVLRGLLDTPLARGHRNPFDWAVSLAIHLAVIAAVVVIPLTFTQALDSTDLRATYLSLPSPPAP